MVYSNRQVLKLGYNKKTRKSYQSLSYSHFVPLTPCAQVQKCTFGCGISELYTLLNKSQRLKGTYIELNALSEIYKRYCGKM